MEVQKILFPEIGRCAEEELYFHYSDIQNIKTETQGKYIINFPNINAELNRKSIYINKSEKIIVFSKGGKLWFDTYFNGFSIEKWTKYTVLDNISLELNLKGIFKITLYTLEKIHDNIMKFVTGEYIANSDDSEKFSFPFSSANGKGMYTFMLESLKDGSIFYGGNYVSDIPSDKFRDVKLGIGICTFRREPFIEKNLRIMRENILDNTASPMHGHLEVFVSDNGQTLDIDMLSSTNIHIFPNRNLGGAGGFTRDLIEMCKANDTLHITHALLMDDDIVIEPEALVKTYTILSLLKDEYKDSFIGGAMLRLDKQYEQVESGASWNGGNLISNKHGLDLRLTDSCLYNEIEEYTEFNAWWYCCFPFSIVKDDNLPLPIFIRGDDVEYGLRNMKDLILLNGVCVWHEPFENKYSSYLEYYITRNQLIDNSFHCQWFGKKQLMHDIILHCMQEIMYYRYKNVDLYLQGIKDFLKGPEWLMNQDGEALHKQVMAAGYKGQELNTLNMPFHYYIYENSLKVGESNLRWWFRTFTFNGLLLRARGENIVPMSAARTIQFYRMKRVMFYDVTSKKAFITEKKIGTSFKYIFKTIGVLFQVSFKLKKTQKKYITSGIKLRTLEFWKDFLGL